jgi:hypothetical protein
VGFFTRVIEISCAAENSQVINLSEPRPRSLSYEIFSQAAAAFYLRRKPPSIASHRCRPSSRRGPPVAIAAECHLLSSTAGSSHRAPPALLHRSGRASHLLSSASWVRPSRTARSPPSAGLGPPRAAHFPPRPGQARRVPPALTVNTGDPLPSME